MNRNIPTPLAILIILLVIAVIVGVALWFCPKKETVPSQDETANWQTYTNAKYGFELKYPKDWFVTVSSNKIYFESPDAYKFIQEGKVVRGSYASNLEISRLAKSEILRNTYSSVLDYLNKDPSIHKIGETTIDGYQGYEVLIGGYGINYGIWTLKDDYVYELSFSLTPQKPLGATENQILSTFKFLEELKEIGPTAVWDCAKIEGCLEKWHNCENLDCISSLMEEYGVSVEAINFNTKILSDRGYLEQFQEMGKIDLGIVLFPDRANTNAAYYLLNGSPVLVSTEISQDKEKELMAEMKKDPLYSEMENKYPDIWFWGFAPKFIEKKTLSNNNEEFVFEYKFVNGCRICDTEYTAKIGFDFDSNGTFLEMVFLQIVKGNI